MKKQILSVVLVVFVLLLVISCNSIKNSDGVLRYSYSVLSSGKQNPEGVYTIPWNENGVKLAEKTGTIRFYFMSGEKQTFSTSAGIKFGDSCLIAFPNGEVMLIDAGMPNYDSILIENLKLLGVSKIDYLVLSHMHDDHYGAMLSSNGVFANFEVGTLYWSGIYNGNESVIERFDTAITRYNINTKTLSRGDSLQIGEVHIDIFNPTAEEIGNRYVETAALNNSSLAMKFVYGDFSALFSGDLYTDGEYRVLEAYGEHLDVDLLKANHHGRSTSNSKEWIQATTPRVVVATCGNPIDETPYAYFAKAGAYVFNDNLDGYIRVVSDGFTSCDTTTSRERVVTVFDNYDKLAQSMYPPIQ